MRYACGKCKEFVAEDAVQCPHCGVLLHNSFLEEKTKQEEERRVAAAEAEKYVLSRPAANGVVFNCGYDDVATYYENRLQDAKRIASLDALSAFAAKYAISQNELVAFVEKATSLGMNLAEATDVEAAYRLIYPKKYAKLARRYVKAAKKIAPKKRKWPWVLLGIVGVAVVGLVAAYLILTGMGYKIYFQF